ncbi:DNA polymerase [Marinomonas arenicola]|uniref:DNA-directed DNA polymerase n=1 Tax=Marinomonas arenicola TaxID=569601 RepID=A0ABU9G8M0_9GAMM
MYEKYDAFLNEEANSNSNIPKQKKTTKTKVIHDQVVKEKFKVTPWPELQETVILAFDTEYQFNEAESCNEVLCYTFSISHGSRSCDGYIPVGSSMRKDRLTFERFVIKCIEHAIESEVLATYPSHLFIVAHFLKADIFNFDKAFDGVAAHLSGIRKTVVSLDSAYGIDVESIKAQRVDKEPLKVRTKSRNTKYIYIKCYDTMLLTPAGKSLSEVGELIDLPKLDIPPPFSIERMKEYQEKDIEGFKEYAIRDAVIARMYIKRVIEFCSLNGLKKLPVTVGSMAVSLFKTNTPESFDLDSVFGYQVKRYERWNTEKQQMHTLHRRMPETMRLLQEQLAISTFHGGRNEAFWLGLTPEQDFNDFDIPSCYTAAMIGLREIDYDSSYQIKDAEGLIGDQCSLALVEFSFPEGTLYPSLPVRIDSGLVYPLSGESFCTGHELEVAIAQNAKIKVKEGMVFPWKNDDRIFESYVSKVRDKRNSFDKGSFDELLWKELGNSLYGKLAQGLRGKNGFDIESGLSNQLPYTALTNPFFATYVTGLARAMLSEILHAIPREYEVISVTTDGFLTNAPLADIPLNGPICNRFNDLYSRICPPESKNVLLEQKHGARQLICMKTRGQVTVKPMEGQKEVLAKAGVRPPQSCLDHNQYMIDLYRNRTSGDTIDASHLRSTRSMYLGRSDMIMEKKTQRLNLEFDFKRDIDQVGSYSADNWEHIGATTKPFKTVQDIEFARASFTGFRSNRCLKEEKDIEDFMDYLAMQKARKDKAVKIQSEESSDGLLIRLFLRFYTRSLLGLDSSVMNSKEMAKWLNDKGYAISPEQVRSAKRSRLIEGAVPRTDKSIRCLKMLLERFSDANLDILFDI